MIRISTYVTILATSGVLVWWYMGHRPRVTRAPVMVYKNKETERWKA